MGENQSFGYKGNITANERQILSSKWVIWSFIQKYLWLNEVPLQFMLYGQGFQ